MISWNHKENWSFSRYNHASWILTEVCEILRRCNELWVVRTKILHFSKNGILLSAEVKMFLRARIWVILFFLPLPPPRSCQGLKWDLLVWEKIKVAISSILKNAPPSWLCHTLLNLWNLTQLGKKKEWSCCVHPG